MIFRSPHPDVDLREEPFTDFVLEPADRMPDEPAIIEGPSGRVMTFGELRDSARAAASGLADRGLQKGDVVAIVSPNVPEYAVAFNAVASAGGVNTTVNPLATVDELAHQFNDSAARFLITVPSLAEKARQVAGRTAIEEVFVFGEMEGATPFADLLRPHGPPPTVEIDPREDLVALPYSSGTTGLPKGVMLTHFNLVANICQAIPMVPSGPGDRVIAVLPFFHIYGMVVVMSAMLRVGSTLVTLPRFELEEFLRTIQEYRVNRIFAVPPIVLALAKHPAVDDYDLSAVEWVMSGAAPLGQEVASACAERLGCHVFQGYGLTEASPVTHTRPPESADEKLASVGPCIPNTEMLIADLESGEPLGAGAEGEVWLRGPQIMKGYLNNAEATAATVDQEGWLHTGDIGLIDEDGYLSIIDRAKELIKYKGYQIAPAELEAVLLSHPAVADAAVIPSPDDEAGEVPKAFVVLKGETGEKDLLDYVAERVAPYKKIRRLAFVEAVPKSASGKILRRLLVAEERARMTE